MRDRFVVPHLIQAKTSTQYHRVVRRMEGSEKVERRVLSRAKAVEIGVSPAGGRAWRPPMNECSVCDDGPVETRLFREECGIDVTKI